jgi:hypothetical protein
MGECWHNNHHAFPGSARLGLYKDEWGSGWWLLCGLRRLGLVWGLRLPADLPARAELRPLRENAPGMNAARPAPTVAGCRDLVASGAAGWTLSGPAAWLPVTQLQRLAGAGRFQLDASGRLALHCGTVHVRGLPALVAVAALRFDDWPA